MQARSLVIMVLTVAFTQAVRGEDLATLLDSAGKRLEDSVNQLSAVTCVETVTRAKLDAKGKQVAGVRLRYDYLILVQSAGGGVNIEESRIDSGTRSRNTGVSLLTSSGFSVLSLIFHPVYQSSFEFHQLPDDIVGGLHTRRLEFRQLKGQRSPSVLVLKDREYPLPWQGVAWLRSGTYEVMRIDARLPAPMEDVGLRELEASVTYAPVRFAGEAVPYWLPASAVISASTVRQHWRNLHQFSAYRRFNVDTTVTVRSGN